MTTTYYFDADGTLRNCFLAATDLGAIGDGLYAPSFNPAVFREKLLAYKQEMLPKGTIIWCISDPSGRYWRHDVFPAYKSQRPITLESTAWALGRRLIASDWPLEDQMWMEEGHEADDLVAIGMTQGHVGISNDKDLDTVPGLRWQEGEARRQEAYDCLYFFYSQILTGDPCDGIPGCPGVGPKKAEALLKGLTFMEMWEAVVKAYKKAQVPIETAIMYARVLRMKRSLDEPLWTPPTHPIYTS